MELFTALAIIVLASLVIMYACDSFDDAASYLGRNMAPGVRGATINAVGSSMPELLTALFLLFLFHDRDGFAAGVATTAGSAIFNSVLIPALCILAVRYRGIRTDATSPRRKILSIQVSKRSILRDGFFLLMAEAALIWFLGNHVMTWWMGAAFLGIYGLYFAFLARGFGSDPCEESQEDEETEDGEEPEGPPPSKWRALLTLDFNQFFFQGREYSTGSAWAVLSAATVVIGIACWQLADAVMASADALGIPAYFTALIFAAAATSVPDTVLSVKDALRGEYDDAIANAIGSNTFDITVGLGLPLFLYAILFGNVEVMSSEQTQMLRIVLFVVTCLVLGIFLLNKRITAKTAYFLLAVYLGWTLFVFYDIARTVS